MAVRETAARDSRRHVDSTRERIVAAYVETCATKGRTNASVAEIARRARVNRTTFYRHFEGTSDLLERGLGNLLEDFFARIEAVAPVGSSDPNRVLLRVTAFFELVEERAKLFRLLLSGAAGPILVEKLEAFLDVFFEERRLKMIEGHAIALPLPLAARSLTSVLLGLVSWWIDHPRAFSAEEMAVHYLRVLEHGLFDA